MRTFSLIVTLITCLSLSAQENSLQASLNKALKADKEITTNFTSLEANIDLSLNAVQLKWENLKTTKTKQFIIERSADNATWSEVSTVFGAPHVNQPTEFYHLDYSPTENISYYRLKALSTDGDEILSNVVPVSYLKKEGATAGMNLHPDFSEDFKIVNIAFEEVFEKEILIVIRDKKGTEYYSKVLLNVEDDFLVAVPIDQDIPKGDYLITATSENQIFSQNVVVL